MGIFGRGGRKRGGRFGGLEKEAASVSGGLLLPFIWFRGLGSLLPRADDDQILTT